jgi:mRNA interferase RelE/StbE
MSLTTIKIQRDTKSQIDQFREYKNESYDEVIKKLIYIVKNLKKEPELSKETIKAIEAARERIKKGHFVSEEEAKYRLGLWWRYTVIYDEIALQNLEKLERKIRKRIFEKIHLTKENPFHYFEKLTARDEFKLRVGDYRVIADIDEKIKRISILFVDHRKNVYKKW